VTLSRLEHWTYDHPANPWLGGGGAYRDWTLLEALKTSFETKFVAAGFDGCGGQTTRWPGTVWVGGGSSPGAARWNWIRGAHERMRELEREGTLPDLFTTSASALAPLPCLLRHVDRTIFVVHHLMGWNALRNVGPLAPLCVWYERALLRRGRNFVVVNRAVEAKIREANPHARIERIPNGIDPSLLQVRRRPDPKPLIVFMGRLDAQMKGLDRLLDAFVEICPRVPGVRLEMAGRGSPSDVRFLQDRIASHPNGAAISFHADVSEADKAELLSRGWVFVAPSRFEGWCIAGVEAQACGLPVVASTADGFLDSVRDGRTGVLVANHEGTIRRDLAEAVIALLTDSPRREAMGEAGREWAGLHTWAALAQRNEAFLRTILPL